MTISLNSPAPLTDGPDAQAIVNNYVSNLQKQNKGKKDFSNEAFTFPKSRSRQILLSELPTSKLARRFENLLGDYLFSFGQFIEQNQDVARRSFSAFMRDVEDTIKSITWNVYWLGIQYVAKFDGVKPFPTDRDLQNVRELTSSISQAVQRRTHDFLDREQEIKDMEQLKIAARQGNLTAEQSGVKKIPKPLSLAKQFRSLATVTTTAALNVGTIDKARQISAGSQAIVNPLIVNGTISAVKYGTGSIQSDIAKINARAKRLRVAREALLTQQQLNRQATLYNDIAAGLGLLLLIPDQRWKGPTTIRPIDQNFDTISNTSKHLAMWKTYDDELVCTKFCEPLEGQVFDMDDASTPIPIRDTHPNCRCRYIFLNEEDQMFLF